MSSDTAILPALGQPPIFSDWKEGSDVMQAGDQVGVELIIPTVTAEQSKALAAREADGGWLAAHWQGWLEHEREAIGRGGDSPTVHG